MIEPVSFSNKTVAVMGLGRSGQSAARALAAAGAEVWAWDDDSATRNAAIEAGIPVTDLADFDWPAADALVLSPGIPHLHPQPHAVAEAAARAGCEIICDVELLLRSVDAPRFTGVTGTNGKSTTCALLGHILREAGRSVEVGGNFGNPALELAPLGDDGYYVLELSSYQLERMPSISLDVAALLNISADHLERHGGIDGYVEAKQHIFDNPPEGSIAVVGMDDANCRTICLQLMAQGGRRLIPVSGHTRVPGGVYADNGILVDDLSNNPAPMLDLRKLDKLPGTHNWQNVAAAYAIARNAGVEAEVIVAAVQGYTGLPHRQERLREIAGIAFINDSKGTNTAATAQAISCYAAVHWIAGGLSKEDGLGDIEQHLERIRHAYLIGSAADNFARALEGRVDYSRCDNLETAVRAAYAGAQASAGLEHPVVLLSPACASFDQFENFEARGEAFREIVEAVT